MKREKILETVKELPPEFELEDLMERLIFMEKVEKGLKQLDEKKTLPHESLKEKVKQW